MTGIQTPNIYITAANTGKYHNYTFKIIHVKEHKISVIHLWTLVLSIVPKHQQHKAHEELWEEFCLWRNQMFEELKIFSLFLVMISQKACQKKENYTVKLG